jgi:hypothetical protein
MCEKRELTAAERSEFSMPVFLNEPLTVLQKSAEMVCFVDLLEQASKEKNSLKRMGFIAAYTVTS